MFHKLYITCDWFVSVVRRNSCEEVQLPWEEEWDVMNMSLVACDIIQKRIWMGKQNGFLN